MVKSISSSESFFLLYGIVLAVKAHILVWIRLWELEVNPVKFSWNFYQLYFIL